jgi:hypothetical protein
VASSMTRAWVNFAGIHITILEAFYIVIVTCEKKHIRAMI